MTRCPHVEQNLAPARSPVPHLPHQRLSSATAPPPALSTQGRRAFASCQGGPQRPRAAAKLDLYKDGQLDLDGMVTRTYPLEGINQGHQDMHDGKNIRGVLVM